MMNFKNEMILIGLSLVFQAQANVRTEYFGLGKYVNGERQWSCRAYDGTVEATFDDAGNNLGANRYGAFGARISNVGEANDREAFQGQDFREDVNHYNLGVRNMAPDEGRWLQPEPLLISGGAAPISPYRYASNNSINRTDPSGLADKGYHIIDHPNGTPFDSVRFTFEGDYPGAWAVRTPELEAAFNRWGEIVTSHASENMGGRWGFTPGNITRGYYIGLHLDSTPDGRYATRNNAFNVTLALRGEGTLVYSALPSGYFDSFRGNVYWGGSALSDIAMRGGDPGLGSPLSLPRGSTVLINGVTPHSSPPFVEGAPSRIMAFGRLERMEMNGGGGTAVMVAADVGVFDCWANYASARLFGYESIAGHQACARASELGVRAVNDVFSVLKGVQDAATSEMPAVPGGGSSRAQ